MFLWEGVTLYFGEDERRTLRGVREHDASGIVLVVVFDFQVRLERRRKINTRAGRRHCLRDVRHTSIFQPSATPLFSILMYYTLLLKTRSLHRETLSLKAIAI